MLGNFGEQDLISLSAVESNHKSVAGTEYIPDAKKLFLDENGIKQLEIYKGKYITFLSMIGSNQSSSLINQIASNLSPVDKQHFLGQFDMIKKCSWYEERLKKYFNNQENIFDFWKLQISKLSGCHLFGSNIYVYQ